MPSDGQAGGPPRDTPPTPPEDTSDPSIEDLPSGNLRQQAARGSMVTLVAEGAARLADLVFVIVLARLLPPEDFGLLGMAAAFTAFMAIFIDMGLGAATVQRPTINHRQISTLFWINLGVGLLLTGLTAIAAPSVSWFFSEPTLTRITMLIGLIFLVGSLEAQPHALLIRRMHFGQLALARLAGIVLGGAIGIASAFMGAGVYALVLRILAATTITMILTWWFSRFWPGRPRREAGVGEMIKMGGYLTGFAFINFFARQMDNILIGRSHGKAALGYYARAYGLMLLPITLLTGPLSGVMTATLSRMQQDRARLARAHQSILLTLSLLAFPVGLGLALTSEETILLLFGSKWKASVEIFRWLALSSMIQPILNSYGWLYVAVGRTDALFRWGLVSIPCIILSIVIGLPDGAMGVARAYTICMFLLFVPCIVYAHRAADLPILPALRLFPRPLAATLGMAAVVLGVSHLLSLQDTSLLTRLCVKIVVGIASYAGFSLLLCRSEIARVLPMVRDLFAKRTA